MIQLGPMGIGFRPTDPSPGMWGVVVGDSLHFDKDFQRLYEFRNKIFSNTKKPYQEKRSDIDQYPKAALKITRKIKKFI